MEAVAAAGEEKPAGLQPHAVVLPFPMQGHLLPMMQLSKILAARGFAVTFVNTEFNLSRLLSSQPYLPHDQGFNIRLVAIPDGLPPHCRSGSSYLLQRVLAYEKLAGPFSALIQKLMLAQPKVSCIICDVLMSWALTVAKQFGIPGAALWTSAASSFAAYYQIPLLISKDYLPIKDISSINVSQDVITCIPGLPAIFRVQDLPSFFLVPDLSDGVLQFIIRQMNFMRQATWVLTNTVDGLESEVEEVMRNEIPIMSVGPLFAATPCGQIGGNKMGASLWLEDDKCLEWLKGRPPASVLYVSFGSVAVLSGKQAEEIAMGLEASKQPFLWAFRPGLLDGEESIVLQGDFQSRTANQGLVVSWSPQLDVLSHPSVGAFFTHCGWNSVMESIWMGKPMLCFPQFAEQRINCRLVEEKWMVGVELRAGADGVMGREEVERVVRSVMGGEEGEKLRVRSGELKEVAIRAMMSEGGSSRCSLTEFVNDLLHTIPM